MRHSSYAKIYNSGLQRASVNDEHFSLLIEISPIRSEKQLWLLENIWLMVTQNKKAVTEIMYPIVIFVYVWKTELYPWYCICPEIFLSNITYTIISLYLFLNTAELYGLADKVIRRWKLNLFNNPGRRSSDCCSISKQSWCHIVLWPVIIIDMIRISSSASTALAENSAFLLWQK